VNTSFSLSAVRKQLRVTTYFRGVYKHADDINLSDDQYLKVRARLYQINETGRCTVHLHS